MQKYLNQRYFCTLHHSLINFDLKIRSLEQASFAMGKLLTFLAEDVNLLLAGGEAGRGGGLSNEEIGRGLAHIFRCECLYCALSGELLLEALV